MKSNPVTGLGSLLAGDSVVAGYVNHVKTAPFYGPFYFSNEYVICQLNPDGKQMLGWEITIEEESILIGERKGRKWIGYHLVVRTNEVTEIDYSSGYKMLRTWKRLGNGKLKKLEI